MLKIKGVDFLGEKYFMIDDYLKMMWRRIYFFEVVFEMGYSFVFLVIFFIIFYNFVYIFG